MSIESLVRHLSAVGDPRCPGKIEHRLIDILVIAVCAVIACAESWDDIALYGRSKLAWLRTFLDLPNGIPSHDTFRRVFMLIDPDAFERGFAAWVGSLVDGFEREVIAIDGKTLRRSFDRRRERSPLHLVSAWASAQGLVLGQRCVHETSNEITAVPELLDQLALENSIVTLDAMGCQTAIAERILARGADYLLVLKANHPLAYEAVAKHFDQTCFRRGAPHRAACDTFDEAHGRLVRRRVFASTKAASLEALSGWPGLHTALAVETLRSTKGTAKVETEIRYFLSSCRDDPVVLGRAIRKHWAHRECAALGARRHLPGGRQSRARSARRPQSRCLAQDRDQSRRARWFNQGQCARQAEKGRLGQRLHAPAPGGFACPPAGRG